ncbi:arginine synthesis PII-interacting regulator PirA [aff. Roholtiella sp. LEGE 12411]|jgi:hypothetical protein|uniref:arginine synthesis PII-interacting regulator PirA n=1 Tax=aff. Roholtiella sp. LEGE 12411 TaxID=1828822 RepID=UPI0018800E3A|nr:hypothetical protein [aff. Roholtiella sp. LEGE 12411]MBE9036714.1 hypothetical protein [aff. Roholtiella sp. LEGE 12411]
MANSRLQATRKAREVHRVNIQRSVEHRLQVARAQGNESLVHQLEAEMKYFS